MISITEREVLRRLGYQRLPYVWVSLRVFLRVKEAEALEFVCVLIVRLIILDGVNRRSHNSTLGDKSAITKCMILKCPPTWQTCTDN